MHRGKSEGWNVISVSGRSPVYRPAHKWNALDKHDQDSKERCKNLKGLCKLKEKLTYVERRCFLWHTITTAITSMLGLWVPENGIQRWVEMACLPGKSSELFSLLHSEPHLNDMESKRSYSLPGKVSLQKSTRSLPQKPNGKMTHTPSLESS